MPDALYDGIKPVLPLGLPFGANGRQSGLVQMAALPDLFPKSFPGVKTHRDVFLVDTDLDRLRSRTSDYFDTSLSHDEVAQRYPGAIRARHGGTPKAVRDALLARGVPDASAFIRYAYRPFDTRWLHWEGESSLLECPRTEYKPHVFGDSLWLVIRRSSAGSGHLH